MRDAQARSIVCGKCGSTTLYSDYLPGPGASGLACMTCGNREGSLYGFKAKEEVEDMGRVKGTCSNCHRPDMMTAGKTKLCGSCQAAIKNTRDPGERQKLLATKADQLDGKPKMNRGRHVITSAVDPIPKNTTRKKRAAGNQRMIAVEQIGAPLQRAVATDCILLTFAPQDKPIFDALMKHAAQYRRDPAQQILWMLQSELGLMDWRAQKIPGFAAG